MTPKAACEERLVGEAEAGHDELDLHSHQQKAGCFGDSCGHPILADADPVRRLEQCAQTKLRHFQLESQFIETRFSAEMGAQVFTRPTQAKVADRVDDDPRNRRRLAKLPDDGADEFSAQRIELERTMTVCMGADQGAERLGYGRIGGGRRAEMEVSAEIQFPPGFFEDFRKEANHLEGGGLADRLRDMDVTRFDEHQPTRSRGEGTRSRSPLRFDPRLILGHEGKTVLSVHFRPKPRRPGHCHQLRVRGGPRKGHHLTRSISFDPDTIIKLQPGQAYLRYVRVRPGRNFK